MGLRRLPTGLPGQSGAGADGTVGIFGTDPGDFDSRGAGGPVPAGIPPAIRGSGFRLAGRRPSAAELGAQRGGAVRESIEAQCERKFHQAKLTKDLKPLRKLELGG